MMAAERSRIRSIRLLQLAIYCQHLFPQRCPLGGWREHGSPVARSFARTISSCSAAILRSFSVRVSHVGPLLRERRYFVRGRSDGFERSRITARDRDAGHVRLIVPQPRSEIRRCCVPSVRHAHLKSTPVTCAAIRRSVGGDTSSPSSSRGVSPSGLIKLSGHQGVESQTSASIGSCDPGRK